jgi:ADP-ribose pyrophosphatase
MSAFRPDGERLIHAGKVVSFSVGRFTAPDGTSFERDIVRHPGAVSVVPLLDDGRIVLVRQYRAAVDEHLLEIPAGKRDVADEPPEVTAGRELEEEVGLRAGSLELLAEFLNSPGFSDERSFVYLATGLTEGTLDLQGIEEQEMSVEHVSIDEIPAMIAERRLTDAKTIIGLTLALRRLGR